MLNLTFQDPHAVCRCVGKDVPIVKALGVIEKNNWKDIVHNSTFIDYSQVSILRHSYPLFSQNPIIPSHLNL